jgi:hypothetical protein
VLLVLFALLFNVCVVAKGLSYFVESRVSCTRWYKYMHESVIVIILLLVLVVWLEVRFLVMLVVVVVVAVCWFVRYC